MEVTEIRVLSVVIVISNFISSGLISLYTRAFCDVFRGDMCTGCTELRTRIVPVVMILDGFGINTGCPIIYIPRYFYFAYDPISNCNNFAYL